MRRCRCSEALGAVGKVTAVLEQISTASGEQQSGIAQINEAVIHLDWITPQNAAMVEELTAAAQSLQGQVESVSHSMRLFRLAAGEATVAEADAVGLRRDAKVAQAPSRPPLAAHRAAPAPAAGRPVPAVPAPATTGSAWETF
jgi:aerotaxis receptor